MRGWEGLSRCRLVGSCVLPWRRFLYIGVHVKPRLHAWHSHRQSRSHFALSSLSDQGEIRLFFIFRNSFFYKITVSFTMVIKRSPGGQACRWRAINFEIHLWSSGKNADCILYRRKFSSAKNFVKSDRQEVRQEFIFVKIRSSLVCSLLVKNISQEFNLVKKLLWRKRRN